MGRLSGFRPVCVACGKRFWTFDKGKVVCGCVSPTGRKFRLPEVRQVDFTGIQQLPPSSSWHTPVDVTEALKKLMEIENILFMGDVVHMNPPYGEETELVIVKRRPVSVDGDPEWIV